MVISGNPAKVIKTLDKERVERERPHYKVEYYGYVPAEKFEQVRKRYIDI